MTVVINGTTGIDTGTGSLIAADSTTPTYLDLFEDTDNGSNYVRLIAPTSVASNKTITLPDATGTMVVGSAAVSAVGQIPFSTDGSSYTPTAKIVSGTSATASGTAVDFTGIPSWVKRVTVMFNGVSTGGTQLFLVQLGDSGGIEITGYASGAGSRSSETSRTDGFVLNPAGSAGSSFTGIIQICNFSSLTWVTSGVLSRSDGFANSFGGSKTLSDVLTQLRITTVSPADTFDLGSFNILYE